MYTNEIVEAGPALSERDLVEVEHAIGYELPPDLRRHYLHFNGGRPVRRYFVSENGSEYEIADFRPVKVPTYEGEPTLEDGILRLVREKRLIPEELVPFANDSGGDFYCIDRRDQSVNYYSMDYSDQPERAVRKIAASLGDFINGMVSAQEAFG